MSRERERLERELAAERAKARSSVERAIDLERELTEARRREERDRKLRVIR